MNFILRILALVMCLGLSDVAGGASPKLDPENLDRLIGIYQVRLSPNGDWLAIVSHANDTKTIRVINLADEHDKTVRARVLPQGVGVNWVKWASNDRLLVSTRQTEKLFSEEFYTQYLFVTDTNLADFNILIKPISRSGDIPSRTLKSGGLGYFNNVLVDLLLGDTDHILMSYDEYASRLGIYKVNIKTRRKRLQNRGLKDVQYWFTDRRGDVRVRFGRKHQSGDWKMSIRDTNSSKWRSVDKYPGLEASTSIFGFTDNPDELIIKTRNGMETYGFYIYDLAQKRQGRMLFHDNEFNVDNVIVGADGKKVVGATYFGNTKKWIYFDTQYKDYLGKISQIIPSKKFNLINISASGSKAIISVQETNGKPKYYLIILASKKVLVLGYDLQQSISVAMP